MTVFRGLFIAGVTAGVVALGWILFIGLPRWTAAPQPATPPAVPEAAAEATPRIKARLYYLAADGLRLQASEREVDYTEDTAEQVRHLVAALLQPPPEPLLATLPAGTTLRNVYFGGAGTAYVDFSPEISRSHAGGSLDELFTVYSVVNTITDNLSAVKAVQILVDGREADTLVGHIDLRRPLQRNLRWAQAPAAEESAATVPTTSEDATPR